MLSEKGAVHSFPGATAPFSALNFAWTKCQGGYNVFTGTQKC